MVDIKKKHRDSRKERGDNKSKPTYSTKGGVKIKRSGPNLPKSNPKTSIGDDNKVCEYGVVPEEESRKNRRYDIVDNFDYQLPEQFKDENIDSDDEDDNDGLEADGGEEDDKGRHGRMLQEITGLPSAAFEGKKKQNNIVISEAYPENEYNPSGDVLLRNGHISIHDLLAPLRGKTGFSKLKKSVRRMEAKPMATHAPLPKPDREKLERLAANEQFKKHITKWEPVDKRNREVSTTYFEEDSDLNFSTVGAVASEFEPRTELEKQMAALVNNSEVSEAHHEDGARLLEVNKISEEDMKGHQDRLAKMRYLLFHHEMKAKRIKKIKSKTYHRLLNKDRLKAAASKIETDPEAAKKLALKQEFKRNLEHATLKHINRGKWAKRLLERGLSVQDEGTRAAFSEQLHQHAELTRKMNSLRNDSNSNESSENDDDDISAGSDDEGGLKLLERAKKKTLELLEDDDIPNSGVLSLPFMVRGLEKRKAAAEEEAKLALQEYETSLMLSKDKECPEVGTSSGRRVFDASKQQVQGLSENIRSNKSEDDHDTKEDVYVRHARRNYSHKCVAVDPNILFEDCDIGLDNLVKKQNLPKTTERLKSKTEVDARGTNSSRLWEPALYENESKELQNDSDTEGNFTMVDGILSAADQSNYELPSQADLIRRAFAGDDVEEEFEKDKEEILNEENPELEKPVSLPGWGQWTNVQKKRGLPSWMLAEHENAKKKREEARNKRKDAHLKNVIVSEKADKWAEKLHTKTLPFPYTSKEVLEKSIRMPIGPEFNPATSIRALNRPEVVKKSGITIKPIKYEDVSPLERAEEHKDSGSKQSGKNQSTKKLSGKRRKNRAKLDMRKSSIQ